MFTKYAAIAVLATSVAIVPTEPARADAGDVAAGLLLGGIIGSAIQNNQRRQVVRQAPRRTTRSSAAPAISAAQRQENRDVQVALNYFGFDAGGADGILGQRSREAVSGMQAFLALPVDGTLTEFERDILLGAHSRAQSGAPDVARMISTSAIGPRSVLQAQRDLMTGTMTAQASVGYAGMPIKVSRAVDEIAASSDPSAEQLLQRSGFLQLSDLNGDGRNDYILDTSVSGSSYWCGANDCQVLVFVSTADGYARNNMLAYSPTPATFDCVGATCRIAQPGAAVTAAPAQPTAPQAPSTVMAAAPAPLALPSFGAVEAAAPSLSSHCGKVSLLTATRGGFVTLASGGDAEVALAEQFCLARNFAIDAGEQVMDAIGASPADAAAQCAAFGPVMAGPIAAASSRPMGEVMDGVSGVVLSSGMTPDQLRTTASVCLASGYAEDDMDVAVGSALLMVALGEVPYAELLGHHLRGGFGTDARDELAATWYEAAIDALKAGAAPAFAPAQTERTDLLVWASGGDSSGRATLAPSAPVAVQAVLPSFGAAPASR